MTVLSNVKARFGLIVTTGIHDVEGLESESRVFIQLG